MSKLSELQDELAHHEASVRAYRYAGANAGEIEALECHDAVVAAQKKCAVLRARIAMISQGARDDQAADKARMPG
ncbi:hypothetical protein [Methylopila sp. 73B]|uniref:hypothetical protein n=1 Tax=Methylopila sp. 73B TaxID=1120792 RepID=UPI00036B9B73|nr:hypothetical protein [Methylopila sp. 73B]